MKKTGQKRSPSAAPPKAKRVRLREEVRFLRQLGVPAKAIATALLLKTGNIEESLSILNQAGLGVEWTIKIRGQKPANVGELIRLVNQNLETAEEVEGTLLVDSEPVDVIFVVSACVSLEGLARAYARGDILDIFLAVVDRGEYLDHVVVAAHNHEEARRLAAENEGQGSVVPEMVREVLRWHGRVSPRVLLSRAVVGKFSNQPES